MLFAFVVALVGAVGFAYAAAAETQNLLNVVRPDARAEARTSTRRSSPTTRRRPERPEHQAVARRLGFAGARAGRRRPPEADVVTPRDPVGRRPDRQGRADRQGLARGCRTTAAPTTARSSSSCAAGNPKGIHDRPDLVKEAWRSSRRTRRRRATDSSLGGGARSRSAAGSPRRRASSRSSAKQVPVLDAGARARPRPSSRRASATFTSPGTRRTRGRGGRRAVEIVYPPISIPATPPLAGSTPTSSVTGRRPRRRRTFEFYTPKAQEIAEGTTGRPTPRRCRSSRPACRRSSSSPSPCWTDRREGPLLRRRQIFDPDLQAEVRTNRRRPGETLNQVPVPERAGEPMLDVNRRILLVSACRWDTCST